jgi:hypothetical protein
MTKYSVFLLVFLSITKLSHGQILDQEISNISFRFNHSQRVPFNRVTIDIIKSEKSVVVLSNSEPRSLDKAWKDSRINKTSTITNEEFKDLVSKVLSLTKMDLTKPLSLSGYDGYYCSIEFGSSGNKVTYTFWSPTNGTEYRGLTEFLDLCKKIIIIGGLDYEKIF